MSELKIGDIDAWADSLIAQQIAVKTLKNKLAIVRSFIKYLYGKNLTNIRPEAVELPPEPQANEMSYLTREEREVYIRASLGSTRDHAIVRVLLSSGVRVSELIAIRVGDIHDRSIIIHKGKGQKRRVVFIDREAKSAIDAYLYLSGHTEGALFRNQYGESLSRQSISNIVEKIRREAGIKKRITVHSMRHTFATLYLEDGGRIEDLQQMLGHADIKTTIMYLHFTNQRLQAAYDTIMT